MNPNWDDMRVFLAVAREESLSSAGRILKIDPATVGRRIARLEALWMPFVHQIAAGLRSDARRVNACWTMVCKPKRRCARPPGAVAGSTKSLSGQIRIGAPDGSANYLLPQVCAKISDANPDLDIQILALPRIINLSRREADMAITVSAPTAGKVAGQENQRLQTAHGGHAGLSGRRHDPIQSRLGSERASSDWLHPGHDL